MTSTEQPVKPIVGTTKALENATKEQFNLIKLAAELARRASFAADSSQEDGRFILIEKEEFEDLLNVLNQIENLPYEQENYILGAGPTLELALVQEFLDDKEIISRKEYVDLVRDSYELNALNNGGVDNWEWHWESRKDHYQEPFPDEPGSRAIED